MKIKFIPECYADTTLARFILRDNSLILHQRANSKVANTMEKDISKYYRLIGVIDDDKRQPLYFQQFKEVKKSDFVILKQKPNWEEYLIVLKPAIEKFILQCSIEAELNILDFDLPDSVPDLREITKTEKIETNVSFKRLLKEISENNSTNFEFLKSLFAELKIINN
jgi:preprotein translocase subunit Sss1